MKSEKQMSSSTSNGQVTSPWNVGQVLENFNAVVEVKAITDLGLLVEIIPCFRNGVAQGGVGRRYYANPNLCKLATI